AAPGAAFLRPGAALAGARARFVALAVGGRFFRPGAAHFGVTFAPVVAVFFALDVEADGRVFGFVLAFFGTAFGVLAAGGAALVAAGAFVDVRLAGFAGAATLALSFARDAGFRFARRFPLRDLLVALFRRFGLDLALGDFLAFEFVQLAGRRQVLGFAVVFEVFGVFVFEAVAAGAGAAVRAERRGRARGRG